MPFIEITGEDHSADEIGHLRALSIVSNNNHLPTAGQPAYNNLIWANVELHNFDEVEKLYNQEPTSAEANLAMAVKHYNDDDPVASVDFLKIIHDLNSTNPIYPSTDLSKKIWFTNRILNLEREPLFKYPEWKEDTARCLTMDNSKITHNMCTYHELKNIDENITKLQENGFLSNFFNNNGKIHALEKNIDTFIIDLNHFIIISLITGPIVFVAGIRFYVKRKLKLSL